MFCVALECSGGGQVETGGGATDLPHTAPHGTPGEVHFVLTKHAMLAAFVHEIAVPSPGHPSAADDARYWLKHVLHSGQGSI